MMMIQMILYHDCDYPCLVFHPNFHGVVIVLLIIIVIVNIVNRLIIIITTAMMIMFRWMLDDGGWLIGANFHDGAVVASYPWDHYTVSR